MNGSTFRLFIRSTDVNTKKSTVAMHRQRQGRRRLLAHMDVNNTCFKMVKKHLVREEMQSTLMLDLKDALGLFW